MKKVYVLIISVLFTLSLIGIVSGVAVDNAAGKITEQKITTSPGYATVTYGATEHYQITIPQEITFKKYGEALSYDVVATEVTLNHDKLLNLTVVSKHGWKMYIHSGSGNNEEITDDFVEYSMFFKINQETGSDDADLTVANSASFGTNYVSILTISEPEDVDTETTSLHFIMEHPSVAGTYKDQLTFHVSTDETAPSVTP